jgi:ubiquitin carboxyl-terminal hydrolase 10
LKNNNRFDAMRSGHQEDAEEFLGFFLDTLHDEILVLIDRVDKGASTGITGVGEVSDEWMEVGSKGRTATTRTVSFWFSLFMGLELRLTPHWVSCMID